MFLLPYIMSVWLYLYFLYWKLLMIPCVCKHTFSDSDISTAKQDKNTEEDVYF